MGGYPLQPFSQDGNPRQLNNEVLFCFVLFCVVGGGVVPLILKQKPMVSIPIVLKTFGTIETIHVTHLYSCNRLDRGREQK